jgi:preprotein translocase subunit YajC
MAMFDLFSAGPALAQTGGAPAAGAGRPGGVLLPQVFLILSFVAIFYFLLLRPQQKRQKQVQEMLKGIKTGDRVLTTGGIFGSVLGLKDDVVVLKIAEDVKIEVAKSAVTAVVQK